MYYFLTLTIFSHFLADFYLQTERMVENKSFGYRRSNENFQWCHFFKWHALHGITHFIMFLAAGLFFFYTIRTGPYFKLLPLLQVGALVLLLHIIIDTLKEYLICQRENLSFWLFLIDQFLHIATLLLATLLLNKVYGFVVTDNDLERIRPILQSLMVILGCTILLKPTSIIVMKFLALSMCDGKIRNISITKSHLAKNLDDAFNKEISGLVSQGSITTDEVKDKLDQFKAKADVIIESLRDKRDNLSIDVSDLFTTNNAGKWIGYIERIMIFIFYLAGQFTAIAAVMAIKTAFRFNDLKDDNDSQRSEYIMLGTFASLFVTILISVFIKHFIVVEHFNEVITIFRKTFL